MDWITLTKQEVENNLLPSICMVCGQPATIWVNKTFTYAPDWVKYLYWAGVFPGVIAQQLLQRQMRVSCPFCNEHQGSFRHVSKGFQAGVWPAAIISLALVACFFILFYTELKYYAISAALLLLVVGAAGLFGLALVVLVTILALISKQKGIKATEITHDEIALLHVADAFVDAVKGRRRLAEAEQEKID